MNKNKDYYKKWKQEKAPETTQDFQKNLENFYASNEPFQAEHKLPPEKEKKKQELLQKTAQMFQRSNALHNPDKKTVGVFYDTNTEGILSKDQMKGIDRDSRASNSIFHPETYRDPEWRSQLMKTTIQSEHNEHQYIGEQDDKRHNLKRTAISEYSNALHNQTVFINPRFMSC